MNASDATPNRMGMDFTVVDGYLLGDAVSKAAVVDAFLRDRAADAAAAPFYRALEAVGARAADEAFVALRLVLAGKAPSDDQVRRLRALSGVARAARAGDRRTLAQVRKRDAAVLGDVPLDGDLDEVATAARSAYAAALRG
jgi:hypothetical protein